ncbi:MAG: hypothetical protein WCW67_02765 [Candidatus Margulisiibacteriota bacterium]|jgi:hypothetical protein
MDKIIRHAAAGEPKALRTVVKTLPNLTAKALVKLYFDGQLEPLLAHLPPQSILALADRPDFRWNIMVKKVAELAATGDQMAAECLNGLAKNWDEKKLDVFASNRILKLVLDNLPPRTIFHLCEITESYDDENFTGPYDLLIAKTIRLAQSGNFDAGLLLEQHAGQWEPEYIDHLADYDHLDPCLSQLSPTGIIKLAGICSALNYWGDDLRGARDRVIIKVRELAENGNEEAKKALEKFLKEAAPDYILHLNQFNQLDKIFSALGYPEHPNV